MHIVHTSANFVMTHFSIYRRFNVDYLMNECSKTFSNKITTYKTFWGSNYIKLYILLLIKLISALDQQSN